MLKEKQIKASMVKQLSDKGADVDHFLSLIDDYVWFWKQEQAMKADIKKNGRSYSAVSSQGKDYVKENPSLKNMLLYNKQKLAILKELGINAENVAKVDDDKL